MFLGEYSHTLDLKGRLTIPARFREDLADGLVITKGYEPCLVLYPLPVFQALAAKAAQMPMSNPAARSYARRFFGGAAEAMPDKMGRVLIPTFLREYAQIRDEAVLVGSNSYIEVWDPKQWEQARAHDDAELAAIMAEMADMGV